MMSIQRPSITRAIGGQWLTYAPPYAWLLPLWFSGSLLSTKNLSDWNDVVIIAAINFAALGITTIEFLVVRRTLWSRSLWGNGVTPVPLVIVGGLLFGITKASLTVWGSSYFYPTDLTELLTKVIASSALGVIVVLIVPIALSELEHYRAQRTELIHRIIAKELSQQPTLQDPQNNLLEEFIEQSLETLASARLKPESLPHILDDIRENQVRPLSHQIWRREQENIPDFTLGNLISVSFSNLKFAAGAVVVGFVLLMGPSQLEQYGLGSGALALVIQSMFIYAGLRLANILRPMGLGRGIFFFSLTNVVLTVLISVTTTQLFGAIPGFLPAQTAIAVFQVLATLTFFTSVYNLTRKTHKAVELDLLQLAPNLGETELSRAQQLRSDRNLAQLLHSQVQNVLLAKSVALKETFSSRDLSDEQKQSIVDDSVQELETYFQNLPSNQLAHGVESFHEHIRSVIALWSPIISIDLLITPENETESLNLQAQLIGSIINEALSNAVRHGLAETADITISLQGNDLSISVEDDGLGPRSGSPSLGTILYNSLPGSSWSLSPSTILGGACLSITFTLTPNA